MPGPTTESLATDFRDSSREFAQFRENVAGYQGRVETELKLIRWVGAFFTASMMTLGGNMFWLAWEASAVRQRVVFLEKTVSENSERLTRLEQVSIRNGERLDRLEQSTSKVVDRLDKVDERLGRLEQVMTKIADRLDQQAATNKSKPTTP